MSLIEQAIAKVQAHKARETASAPAKIPVPERAAEPVALPRARASLQLPFHELRTRGLLPPEHMERSLAEQYRAIKRPLIACAAERGNERGALARSIVVASSTSGEGKTFTSLNLAMNLALERDLTCVLFDGDVAKQELSEALGVQNQPGLLDLLQDPSLGIESTMLAVERPRMMFVPAGKARGGAPELLTSARMRTLVTDFLTRYPTCVAVFDSPPLLLTSEARALMQVAGQAVLVVHAGTTQRSDVMDAITEIGGGPSVSLLLNQTPYRPETRYGYATDSGAPAAESAP
jgi:Mrp family chromosome partitioning ATPase